jgi:hypothetical protein
VTLTRQRMTQLTKMKIYMIHMHCMGFSITVFDVTRPQCVTLHNFGVYIIIIIIIIHVMSRM